MDTFSTQLGSQDSNTFNFFGLPRELRDMIYVNLIKPQKEIAPLAPGNPIAATLEDCPLPHVLRINKQFSQEYEERLQHFGANLVLTHPGHQPLRSLKPPRSIQGLPTFQKLTINIILNYQPNPFDYSPIITHLFCEEAMHNWKWMRKAIKAIARPQDIRNSQLIVYFRRGIRQDLRAEDPSFRRIMEESLGMLRSKGLSGSSCSCILVKRLGREYRPWPIPEDLDDYGEWTEECGWRWI
ncbi:hypothetical protein CERZMDRAFT_92523 [Cercospora zeae-maydis SCOH1-5]|uniref:Uncharacterized protein n=1 Tax=Cercospora zeae-maydis SCOH1-5 TaxID=717836 RepID=A0A6A6FWV6_9PEZI|nr:hypothetical protein CERZMDRAFT_92523 [Cercospora zeae-maydis SCOH1-5]